MKVLVTGNLGFIGSHLTRRLLDDGWDVVGIDNGCTGDIANLRRLGIGPHDVQQLGGSMDVAEVDSRLSSWQRDHLRDVEAIFHFACPASPVMYQRYPMTTYRAMVAGTLALIELANVNGSPILLASTSEVYGDPEVHPQPETYRGCVNTLGPRSIYDEGKRMAEALIYHFAEQWTIVRIFNTYGPNMAWNDGRLLPNLFSQGIEGKPLTVYGDGSQTRSFCYIDDMIRGIMLAHISPLIVAEGPYGDRVFNLGRDEETTVLSIAERIGRTYGVGIEFEGLPKDDPVRRRPDVSKANKYLGWSAKIDLVDGLESTREYFERIAVEQ